MTGEERTQPASMPGRHAPEPENSVGVPTAVMVCFAKCWSCITQQCPGGWHTWADDADIEHARVTQQGDPTTSRCGCPCADGPVIEQDGPPDLDEPVSLNLGPCPLCGEGGACAYDDEGRALIHALGDDE